VAGAEVAGAAVVVDSANEVDEPDASCEVDELQPTRAATASNAAAMAGAEVRRLCM
jgi:hypothetical protein